MITRTVILILVASLLGSQGAAISSPHEDQFDDFLSKFLGLLSSQKKIKVPSAASALMNSYSASTIATPYTAPAAPANPSRPPNQVGYQSGPDGYPGPASYQIVSQPSSSSSYHSAPAPFQPRVSAPAYPSTSDPEAPIFYNSYSALSTTDAPFTALPSAPAIYAPAHPPIQAFYQAVPSARQPPINIIETIVVPASETPALTFTNYDIVFPQQITNKDLHVMIQLHANGQKDAFPSISNGNLNGVYIFDQLHFHWGHDDNRGSEHIIKYTRYPAELHLVHYNSKYGNFDEATKHQDGLAVLVVFLDISKQDNIAFRHLEHEEKILDTNSKIVSSVISKPIALEDLLPDETVSFYRYFGSITTPNLHEVATWTVFDTPIAVSERQMNNFCARFRPLF